MKLKSKWKEYKTNMFCRDCGRRLIFKELKSYDYNLNTEPSFLDEVFCKKCNQTFPCIDAFFYSIKPLKLKRLLTWVIKC